jgi:hypothetical protein
MQDGDWAHPPIRFIDHVISVACQPCTVVDKLLLATTKRQQES